MDIPRPSQELAIHEGFETKLKQNVA